MRIVCLGDSCTYGQNVRATEAWPAVLHGLTGKDVRNEGVCGDTTRQALDRYRYACGLHKPDVVVLQFGHNDANAWDGQPRVMLAAYLANLHELAYRAQQDGARKVLLITPHNVDEHPDQDYQARVKRYAAAAEEHIPGAKRGDVKVTLLDDGYYVHPDPAMHRRYAEKIAACI